MSFYIDGIQHNVPFLAAVMQNPRWRSGKLSTGFIKEEFPDGFVPRKPEGKDLKTLAAVAAVMDHLGNQRRRGISHQMAGQVGALRQAPRGLGRQSATVAPRSHGCGAGALLRVDPRCRQ